MPGAGDQAQQPGRGAWQVQQGLSICCLEAGQRQKQAAEGFLGTCGETTPTLSSSDLSHQLLLHLHRQRFQTCLCNCVHRVPASLPSSDSILSSFAASLLLDNRHLAIDCSTLHWLGLFCPTRGKFAPVGLPAGFSAGFHTGFYCQQHLLSSPITPSTSLCCPALLASAAAPASC